MTIRVAFGAMIILCAMITTGCWDRKEVKDLAIVTATGLDLDKDGNLTQSVQIAIPSAKNAGQSGDSSKDQKTFFVISAKGKTLADSRQNLQQKIHLKLYYSHRRVIIIGERMARHGLEHVLDSFHRELDMRMRNMVFVTKGIDASKILNFPVTLESIPADQFQKLDVQPSGKSTTIMDFDAMASSEGIDPIMGAFGMVREHATSKPKDAGSIYKLYGVGVFKNLKLIGYLNDEETRALNWVTGNIADAYLTTSIPQGHGNVSVHILDSKHAIRADIVKGAVKIRVAVQSQCELIENGTALDFTSPENMRLVNDLLSSQVKQSIEKSIRKTQEQYNADVFGFGRILHVTHPQQWRQLASTWSTLYPKLEISVNARVSVIDTGFAKEPLYRNERTGDVE